MVVRASETLGRSLLWTPGRRLYHFIRRELRKSNSNLLGLALRASLLTKIAATRTLPTGAHRSLASTCQPIDPLRSASNLPRIDVAVPFVEKDLPALRHVIEGVLSAVVNPIANVFLVTPGYPSTGQLNFASPESNKEITDLRASFPDVKVRFDREVLGENLAAELLDNPERKPGGWHLQQVLKFALARSSGQAATLIVDADTVLLSPKTWLASGGVQLLQFSEEFHRPYMEHFRTFFGLPKRLPVSFVTHHQLMQTDVVNQMFPTEQELTDWLALGSNDPSRKISEYESYGSFLAAKCPGRVAFGTWSNLWSPHLKTVQLLTREQGVPLRALLPDYCSVSFHSHSQVERLAPSL